MRRGLLALFAALLLMVFAVPAYGVQVTADGPSPAGSSDEYAFVRFADAPIAAYDGSVAGFGRTKPDRGKKLNLNSPAAKQYGNRLEAQRNNYIKWLQKHYPQVEVVEQYSVTFNGLGLKLNGATLKNIQGGPGAVEANLSGSYTKAMNASHGLIHSGAVWTALGGQDGAGAGIKVGIIDSGIDQNHPFLNDAGMTAPAGFPLGETQFTTNKVIVARTFHQSPWMTAEAVDSHGTHVAGTVAGRSGTLAAPAGAPLSGVAPGAYLGNYNVFPGTTENAKSLFIAKAVEQAVIDGMDVLNLSLGGGAHRGKDILDMAVNAAVDAGVVVAIAAGNEGPGNYTVGSPGTASNVITVAAITNSHLFAGTLKADGLLPASGVMATPGDGGATPVAMTGQFAVYPGDEEGCSPAAGPLTGQVALISRGTCTFTQKIQNAAAAGAVAVVVYQNRAGEPIPMSTPDTNIPAVMIGQADGLTLKAAGTGTVSIDPALKELPTAPNRLADFSSWGPTPNYTLKPDVAAPGVNIYSSVVGGGFEAYNGTSMATPHVAGSAALLLAYSRENNLGWGPAEVKAALMGTARPAADTDLPLHIGAGIIDLERAMNPPAMAFPSSLSFGLVRPVGNHTYSLTFEVVGTEPSYTATGDANVDVSVSTAGGKTMVTVTAKRGEHSPGQGGYPVFKQGFVTVTAAAGDIRVPYLIVWDYNR